MKKNDNGYRFSNLMQNGEERSLMQMAEREKMRKKKIKRNSRIIMSILIVIVAIPLFFDFFYTVSESEQVVVERFGAYQSTQLAGPHFKIPFIERIIRVKTANRIMTIGYDPNTNETIPEEAKMITGDGNIANVDFYITWKVTDAYQFLYASSDPELIFKNIIQASARSVNGSQTIDNVLTSGKVQIQSDIKDRIINALQEQPIGISLVELIIQDAEPADNAEGQVTAAFKDVETAKQNQEQLQNEGQTYLNEKVPAAKAEADKIRQSAEAYKATRIAQASGETQEFLAMYEEYSKNPEIVKKRMYLETIERVLPELKVYIDASASGESSMLKVLPLGDYEEEEK